jgi:hypothetical protein
MGLLKKAEALLSLNPDLAVIQECSEASMAQFQRQGFEVLWFGLNTYKGLGVF